MKREEKKTKKQYRKPLILTCVNFTESRVCNQGACNGK